MTFDLFVGILMAAIGSGVVFSAAQDLRHRLAMGRIWLAAAKSAGLTDVSLRSPMGWPRRVEGRRGPLTVRMSSSWNQEAGERGTRIEIGGLTTDLGLKPAGGVALERLLRERDIDVGDDAFDAAVVVTGKPVVARALLDAPMRRRLQSLFATRAIIRVGQVVLESFVQVGQGSLVAQRLRGDDAEWIASGLDELLSIAEALLPGPDLPPRLLANVRDDPVAGVRRLCLATLRREYEDHPATVEAGRLALRDVDDAVRLDAAVGLGAEGVPTLLEIATNVSSEDDCAARAVAELKDELPTAQAREALARALLGRRLRTAQACVESLGLRGPEQADVLTRVLAAEEGLLAVAAARALGRVGTAPDVASLMEAEAQPHASTALRRAAREAVSAIQARLVGAGSGQVSLSAPEPGRLGLADGEAGRVSLQEDEGKGPA